MNTGASKTEETKKTAMNGNFWRNVSVIVLAALFLGCGSTVITVLVQAAKHVSHDELRAVEKEIKEWVEAHYPPQWAVDDLTEIKQVVKDNQKTLHEHILFHSKEK